MPPEPDSPRARAVPEEPCPRCGGRCVLRLVDGYFVCPRCQVQWRRLMGAPLVTGLRLPEPASAAGRFPFSAPELERLRGGRAAVRASFYTDAEPRARTA